jgi:hypothetical protein
MFPFLKSDPPIYSEQLKLSATFFNNLAAAFLILGAITPAMTNEVKLAYSAVGGGILAFGLHLWAVRILRGLRQPGSE